MKPNRASRQPEGEGEIRFVGTLAPLPAVARPALLSWLRNWRRALDLKQRPERVFWVLDVKTGEWKRL